MKRIVILSFFLCAFACAQTTTIGKGTGSGQWTDGTGSGAGQHHHRFGCIGAAPTYLCSNRSTLPIQTPNTPPFSGTVGYNAIGYDTSMNPRGIDPILRGTDSTMLSGHSPSSTFSGGDNDEEWSCTGRTDTSAACRNATLYFLGVAFGGSPYVEGIKIVNGLPTVVAPFPQTGPSFHPVPSSALSFSNQDPTVSYMEAPVAGDSTVYKVVYAWDGIQGDSPTFTQTLFYDFGVSCAPFPLGVSFHEFWSGPLSHDVNDNVFAIALSNVLGLATGIATAQVANGSPTVTVTTTSIGSAVANAGALGTGYVVGDQVTVTGGTGGNLRVTSVNGSGGVTGLTLVGIGKNYVTGSNIQANGGSGSGLHVDVTVGMLADGSLNNAVIKLGSPLVSYKISSVTLSTITLTTNYSGSGCASSCQMNIPNGQGTGHYVVAFQVSPSACAVWDTIAGTVTASGAWTGGTVDSGCVGMYLHDGFLERDGIYGEWSGASTGTNCGNGSNFWQTGTTHDVACTATTTLGGHVCGGHDARGYHNEMMASNPNYYNFDPAIANTITPIAPFTAAPPSPYTALNCEDHFSWRNALPGETSAAILSSANNNYVTSGTTSSWASPYMNEVDILFHNGTIGRGPHNFILGPGPGAPGCNQGPFAGTPLDTIFTAQQAIGAVSQDGRMFEWSSSMLGQLGTDVDGGTRADIFVTLLE